MIIPNTITGISVKILLLSVLNESYMQTFFLMLSSVNYPVYITL